MSSTNIRLSELAKNLTDSGQIDRSAIAGLSNVIDSSGVLLLIDSDYVAARSAAGGLDSASVINLIDSDYVQARQSASGGGGGASTGTSIAMSLIFG